MFTTILATIIDFATLFMLVALFLAISVKWGIESLRKVAVALYLAVMLWLMFPHHVLITSITGDSSLTRAALFGLFLTFTTWVASYFLHNSFEKPFEFLGKKIVYALAVSIQTIIIAAHIIAFTTYPLLNSGILLKLFGDPDIAFYWFVAPLILIALF